MGTCHEPEISFAASEIRRFLPNQTTCLFLRRGLIIRPGLETSEPYAAVERYRNILEKAGISLAGKLILIFGYGGSFAVGAELLRRGAAHVVLCDKYALPDNRRNR